MRKSLAIFLMYWVGMLACTSVLADTASYWAKVSRVISSEPGDTSLGECAAVTSPGPQSTGLNCGNNFVTFDCKGQYGSKSSGSVRYSNAQLAMVTDKYMRIIVDDSRKHNGYCLAVRADATTLDTPP